MAGGGRRSRGACARLGALVLLAAMAAGCTEVGRATSPDFELDAPTVTSPTGELAIDPDVRIVTLDNGLTVYLRHNETPGYNAELRLVVNAGSLHETADQSGVAHFLEHMLFNGTASWPGNELIGQLREFGMEFGADVNAYTSYDETVYELSVPAGPGQRSDGSPVEVGLDILAEWLSSATIDPAQVDAEVGVVLDEWRTRQSFDGRLAETIAGLYLAESAYRDRSPIGTADAIRSMTADRLRAFYDAWYRPDNAAIVVVGHIDVDDVEEWVEERFGGLAPRRASVPRPDATLQDFDAAAAAVLADPDTSVAEVELALPGPRTPVTTPATLRGAMLVELAMEMLVTRLGDDLARGEADFIDAYRSDNSVVRDLDAPSIVVTADLTEVDAAIDALLVEFERADRFGFTANELDRVLAAFRSAAEARYAARDSVSDAEHVEDAVHHFLAGDPPIAADVQRDTLLALYDSINAGDVSEAFSARYHESGSYVLVVAPDEMAATLPTVDALLARLAGRAGLVVEPRVDSGPIAGELMPRPEPVVEADVDEMADDEFSFLDPVLLTFPNGARVVLNPSEMSDDSVVLAASSPGGLSLVDDADVANALQAVEVVLGSGLGQLDAVQLDALVSASSVELYPFLDPTAEGFSGASTTDDLETLLQLVAMYLVQPRFDQVALDATIDSWLPVVDDPAADPDLATYVTYSELRFPDEPRYAPVPTRADLESLDLEVIERVWRERFSSPGDWVFALSGDFDVDEVTELVRSYIGSLDAGPSGRETATDRQPAPPDRAVSTQVRAGEGQTAALTRVYEVALDPAALAVDRVAADVATGIVTNRLTDRVREELGASYSPYGSVSVQTDPDLVVQTVVEVTGDPEHVDELAEVVGAELDSLLAAGPTEREFDDAMAAVEQSYDLFDDDSLARLLVEAATDERVLDEFIDRRDTLSDIAIADLREFLAVALSFDRYIEVQRLPV